LCAAAPIGRSAVSNHGHRHPFVLARPMTGLPLSIAEGTVPLGFATFCHDLPDRYVTVVYGCMGLLSASRPEQRLLS
jgi:hypothetical protein